ncbi:MAG: cupin domain-containing protein [Alphaproteobacteria bacterium]|nr:cupin domain-containing protein [Alphaproteobacteria bacterium]
MRFSVQHAKDGRFDDKGLRSFFEYRDLGIDAATDGRFHAQVIRAKQACPEGTGRHTHSLDFQMVYVLRGWVEFEYEGQGRMRLEPGACVHQPPGIVHELVACSDECELLEITAPADFDTRDA